MKTFFTVVLIIYILILVAFAAYVFYKIVSDGRRRKNREKENSEKISK